MSDTVKQYEPATAGDEEDTKNQEMKEDKNEGPIAIVLQLIYEEKEGKHEMQRVIKCKVRMTFPQQWVITYLDIPGFGGTNRYSSPHS